MVPTYTAPPGPKPMIQSFSQRGRLGGDLPADAEVAGGVFIHVLGDVARTLGVLDLGRVVGPGGAVVVGDGELGAPVAEAQEGPEAAGVGVAGDEVDGGAGVSREARAPDAVRFSTMKVPLRVPTRRGDAMLNLR
jgi:hypothetical protein